MTLMLPYGKYLESKYNGSHSSQSEDELWTEIILYAIMVIVRIEFCARGGMSMI